MLWVINSLRDCSVQNLRFLRSPTDNKMSNTAVEQQNFDAKDPFAGLALVTKPVPKAEPGHVVVRITLRPVNPTDLISISSKVVDDEKFFPGVCASRTGHRSIR